MFKKNCLYFIDSVILLWLKKKIGEEKISVLAYNVNEKSVVLIKTKVVKSLIASFPSISIALLRYAARYCWKFKSPAANSRKEHKFKLFAAAILVNKVITITSYKATRSRPAPLETRSKGVKPTALRPLPPLRCRRRFYGVVLLNIASFNIKNNILTTTQKQTISFILCCNCGRKKD